MTTAVRNRRAALKPLVVLALSVVALVAVAFAQPVSASTSVVSDPVGDAFLGAPPGPAPGYQDIVQASVASDGSSFNFVMDVSAPIPSCTALPPGVALQTWQFIVNTNPATSPKGYPFAPGIPAPSEYFVVLACDGTAFKASAIDRTPLLTGGQATETAVSFSFADGGLEVTLSTSAATIGSPSNFTWRALAFEWRAPFGTNAFFLADVAPNIVLAPWPAE